MPELIYDDFRASGNDIAGDSMRIFIVKKLLLIAVVLLPLMESKAQTSTVRTAQVSADQAWASLIQAKGGRDRLHAVNNLLRDKENGDVVRLDVFPDDVWEFKGLFYGNLSVNIYDGRLNQRVYANQKGETDVIADYERQWISLERILYLLETKWEKPELIRVRRIQEGKTRIDVIEALVGSIRIDFHYEPEEMLVRRIDLYDKQGVVRQSYSFSDYRDVDGIKMPMAVGQKSCYCDLSKEKYFVEKITYSFNVKYDPLVFSRPLKAISSDAWMRK